MGGDVSYGREGAIALITIDHPPVNAMSLAVRQGIWDAMERLASDRDAGAAVLFCAGRTWSAGADITEFDQPPRDPWLPQMVQKIEDSPKLVVAAIHGTALGGGLETALGCHYRCAVPSAKLGFPEVNLGLIPGAGGTQRVPRIAGVRRALDLIVSGKPIGAREALECGLIDELVEGDLKAGAIACARRLLESRAPIRRIAAIEPDRAAAPPALFADFRKEIAARTRGFAAPERVVRAIEAAVQLPWAEGMRRESDLFRECMQSAESKAQRHLFFAEREATKLPDVPKDTPLRSMSRVAVVGAGTMGGGIAMCFASAGVPVTLLEVNQAALDRGLGAIRKNYASAVEKGRMDAAQLERTMALLRGSTDHADLIDADLVVEAVFESMQVKLEVFAKLDSICRPGAILATNTSTLDVDEIARATRRPEDVIGLHFFAPANIMPLLEIVRGARTANDVLATSMDLAKRIRKIAVVVGVCFGFVANRMFIPYIREAQQMILEGTTPERIDRAAVAFGMAMGPNAVCDLSGIDVFRNLLAEWKERPADPSFCRMIDVLHGMNRLGQKTGAGFYRYSGRSPAPDPDVMAIAAREASALGVVPRAVDDAEIVERLMCALVNEGARVLEDGIARSPGDIDVIFANGFGFPRWRGGPMFHADTLGPRKVYDAVCRYRERYGVGYWSPAPLLERLSKSGKEFAEF
jgi:3-hydroxyacyl-CoA dehydrogenase